MALEVIGTGFGRTGTMSLKLALEELGFGKCYHMYELIEHPDDIVYFEKGEKGEEVDWDKLLTGYKSGVDFPIILFYKELMAKYPNARIIHTTRDPESWYKSFKSTILWAVKPSLGRILKMMVQLPFSKRKRKFLKVLQYNGRAIKNLFGKYVDSKEDIIRIY
ncbi:MAG: sulfotransferase family protein, partial [Chitinophagales bacterium]